MAPYEPKIESKEFELPNAGQDPASPAVADTDITIRLWQPDRTAAGPLTWRTESVLVYMIADLVAASRGSVDESTPTMTAHFNSSGQALVAAKRIQNSILEFLLCRSSDPLAAAILIHQPSTAPGGFSAALAQAALRLAEPGQVLLSEETARRLHDLPGIELRRVPALTTGGDEQAGLSELVWTSPERMAQMRIPAGTDRNRAETAPMGATMIVNASLGGARQETGKAAQSALGVTGLSAQDKNINTRSQKVSSPEAAISRDFGAGQDNSLQQGLEETGQPPFLTRTTMMIGGVVAVLLVGAVVWLFYPQPSRRPVQVQQNPPGKTEKVVDQTPVVNNPPQPPVSTVPDSAPKTPEVLVTPPPAPKATKDKHPTNKAKDIPIDKQKVAEEPPPPPPPQVVDGMTQRDIPDLLRMARTDAGGGKYEKARREYTIVLKLQPSNTDAKEGLRRLDIAQSVQ